MTQVTARSPNVVGMRNRVSPLQAYMDEWHCVAFPEEYFIDGRSGGVKPRSNKTRADAFDALSCFERLTKASHETVEIWAQLEEKSNGISLDLDMHWSIFYFLVVLECRKTVPLDTMEPAKRAQLSKEIHQAFQLLDFHLKLSGLDKDLFLYPEKTGQTWFNVSRLLTHSSKLISQKIQLSKRTKSGANANAIRFFRRLRDYHVKIYGTEMRRVIAHVTNTLYDTNYTTNDITKNL